MNELKFLGKPAPEYLCCCGTGEYCNERAGDKDCPCEAKIESLEGAIKEAAIMIREDLIADGEWWEWRHNFEKLLRQTIGERT